VIEGWFEGLVFNEEALVRTQLVMRGAQCFLEPSDPLADALGAGIIGAVRQPKGEITAA
jgi:hypothetical protein